MTDWQRVIRAIAPRARADILSGLAAAMPGICSTYAINTTLRQAHFLAQCAHESDGFHTCQEYASGAAYEGRRDLGNTHPGDGKRFKGRGILQLTGRSNYTSYGKALGIDLVDDPDLAADFPAAALIAALYWKQHSLNPRADADDIEGVTRRVNGGLNGLDDRKQYLALAKRALKPVTRPVAAVALLDDGDAPELSSDAVSAIQTRLRELGYNPGIIDGNMGGATRAALTAFQTDNALPITGDLDDATKTELASSLARHRPIAKERAEATVDDLRAAGSQTIAAADAAESGISVKTILTSLGIGSFADVAGQATQAKTFLTDQPWIVRFVVEHPLLIASVVAAGLLIWQRRAIHRSLERVRGEVVEGYRTFRITHVGN